MATNGNYKVLMIDDDEVIAQTTAEYFNMFDVRTKYVTSYDKAVEFLEGHMVDLLLLDINLGDKSGFDLCKKVREDYDMPIFFISARTSDDDVLIALNVGGDDYIKKPYTLNVLLAKVKTVLARYEKARTNTAVSAGGSFSGMITDDIKLDTNTHKLEVKGEQVALKAMEYKILVYLLRNSDRVIPKEEIFEKIWDTTFVGDVTLNVHIRHLREKIEDDAGQPRFIKTVWGVGFMLDTKGTA